MNLYRIDFLHYGPKDYKRGTWGFVLAEDDAHVLAKLERLDVFRFLDGETVEVFEDEDEEDIVSVPLRDHIIKNRGETWREPEDAYYGCTFYEWHLVKRNTGHEDSFVHGLAQVGLFREVDWGCPIAIVAAVGKEGGEIGYEGKVPWHLGADLKRFRELTEGHTVVMGRRTWESLPEKYRPLPRRHNIVLTSDLDYKGGGPYTGVAQFSPNLETALLLAPNPSHTIFVIGGEKLFREALRVADTLHITWVDYEGPCDTWWRFRPANFQEDESLAEIVPRDANNDFPSEYRVYKRTQE